MDKLKQNSHNHLNAVQILRAIAALMVVVAHLYANLKVFGDPKDSFIDFRFGAAGVDLFFVISGFVMLYASKNLFNAPHASMQFFLRRLIRIVPIYWVATTLIAYRLPANWNLSELLASYAFIPLANSDGSSKLPVLAIGWTLNYEMFFYLCFSLIVVFPRRIAIVSLTLFFLVLINYGNYFSQFVPSPISLDVWTNQFLYEFLAGVWVAMALVEGVRINHILSILLIICAIGMMIIAHNSNFTFLPRYVGWGGGSAMIIAALTLTKSKTARTSTISKKAKPWTFAMWKPLIFLGNASYSLYIMHALIPGTYNRVITRFFNFDPLAHPYLYGAGLLAASIIVACIVHILLEKPLTKYLQKLLARIIPTNKNTTTTTNISAKKVVNATALSTTTATVN